MKMQNAKCKMLNRKSKNIYKHSSLCIHHCAFTKGFTLVELMIVVGIIAALSVAGALSYSSILKRSRDSKRKADIEQIRSALEMYRSDTGSYPVTGSSWESASSALGVGVLVTSYIPKIPDDPYVATQPYEYICVGAGTPLKCYVYCLSGYLEQGISPDTTCSVASYPSTTGGVPYNYARRSP